MQMHSFEQLIPKKAANGGLKAASASFTGRDCAQHKRAAIARGTLLS